MTSTNNSPSNSPKQDITIEQLQPHEPSLCIPRVFPNITEKRILAIFRELQLGDIDHLDIIKRQDQHGKDFLRVFIHFKSWNEQHTQLRLSLSNVSNYQFKVVYDQPWFWLISKNHAHKHNKPKPKIDLIM